MVGRDGVRALSLVQGKDSVNEAVVITIVEVAK